MLRFPEEADVITGGVMAIDRGAFQAAGGVDGLDLELGAVELDCPCAAPVAGASPCRMSWWPTNPPSSPMTIRHGTSRRGGGSFGTPPALTR